MKILIWGGKSNTNVLLKMLSDIHPGKAQFSGIFDPYIKELSFKTNIKFFNKKKKSWRFNRKKYSLSFMYRWRTWICEG